MLTEPMPGLSRRTRALHAGPLSALALFDDVARQRMINDEWIQRKMTTPAERLSPPLGYRHDRIRLGYMSSDFCQHAMSLLIAELFERHDRQRFEVFGYCSSPEDGTEIRQRVIAAFDHFTRIADLTDEQAALAIRADEIDILIDLNGLTSGTRLQVARWRPAPVQATYLGFHRSQCRCRNWITCSAIRLSCRRKSPPEYRPTPLYVAEFYQANDSKRAKPEPRSRAELGLPETGFVFCCFSNHYKITAEIFALWMEILRQGRQRHVVVDRRQCLVMRRFGQCRPRCRRSIRSGSCSRPEPVHPRIWRISTPPICSWIHILTTPAPSPAMRSACTCHW